MQKEHNSKQYSAQFYSFVTISLLDHKHLPPSVPQFNNQETQQTSTIHSPKIHFLHPPILFIHSLSPTFPPPTSPKNQISTGLTVFKVLFFRVCAFSS
jgi:hypothetical protein